MNDSSNTFFSFDDSSFTEALLVVDGLIKKIIEENNEDSFICQASKKILLVINNFTNTKFQNILNENTYCRSNKGYKFDLMVNQADKVEAKVEICFALMFCYLSELYFRGRLSKSFEIGSFFDFGQENIKEFSSLPQKFLYHALYSMPTDILKMVFNSNEMRLMRETSIQVSSQVDAISHWSNTFEEKKREVEELRKDLDTYKSAYNFVGLFKGFESLRDSKVFEKVFNQICLCLLTVFILCFIATERNSLGALDFKDANVIYHFLSIIIPSALSLLFLLYLFRIFLSNISSAKSQLLQINLRMTLCQFIENYAERAEVLSVKHKEGFEKFENIIFSPIVSTADQMPSTFDGVDQMANLIKAIRINDAVDDKPKGK